MPEQLRNCQPVADLYGSADLAALRADIAKGMSDVQAGRVGAVSMASIKATGRAKLKTQRAN